MTFYFQHRIAQTPTPIDAPSLAAAWAKIAQYDDRHDWQHVDVQTGRRTSLTEQRMHIDGLVERAEHSDTMRPLSRGEAYQVDDWDAHF